MNKTSIDSQNNKNKKKKTSTNKLNNNKNESQQENILQNNTENIPSKTDINENLESNTKIPSELNNAIRKCIRKGDRICYSDLENITVLKKIQFIDTSRGSSSSLSEDRSNEKADTYRSGESLFKTFTFEQTKDIEDPETTKCIKFWESVMKKNLKPIKCTLVEAKTEQKKQPSINLSKKSKNQSQNTETKKMGKSPLDDMEYIWAETMEAIRTKKLDKIRLFLAERCQVCIDPYIESLRNSTGIGGEQEEMEQLMSLDDWEPRTEEEISPDLLENFSIRSGSGSKEFKEKTQTEDSISSTKKKFINSSHPKNLNTPVSNVSQEKIVLSKTDIPLIEQTSKTLSAQGSLVNANESIKSKSPSESIKPPNVVMDRKKKSLTKKTKETNGNQKNNSKLESLPKKDSAVERKLSNKPKTSSHSISATSETKESSLKEIPLLHKYENGDSQIKKSKDTIPTIYSLKGLEEKQSSRSTSRRVESNAATPINIPTPINCYCECPKCLCQRRMTTGDLSITKLIEDARLNIQEDDSVEFYSFEKESCICTKSQISTECEDEICNKSKEIRKTSDQHVKRSEDCKCALKSGKCLYHEDSSKENGYDCTCNFHFKNEREELCSCSDEQSKSQGSLIEGFPDTCPCDTYNFGRQKISESHPHHTPTSQPTCLCGKHRNQHVECFNDPCSCKMFTHIKGDEGKKEKDSVINSTKLDRESCICQSYQNIIGKDNIQCFSESCNEKKQSTTCICLMKSDVNCDNKICASQHPMAKPYKYSQKSLRYDLQCTCKFRGFLNSENTNCDTENCPLKRIYEQPKNIVTTTTPYQKKSQEQFEKIKNVSSEDLSRDISCDSSILSVKDELKNCSRLCSSNRSSINSDIDVNCKNTQCPEKFSGKNKVFDFCSCFKSDKICNEPGCFKTLQINEESFKNKSKRKVEPRCLICGNEDCTGKRKSYK